MSRACRQTQAPRSEALVTPGAPRGRRSCPTAGSSGRWSQGLQGQDGTGTGNSEGLVATAQVLKFLLQRLAIETLLAVARLLLLQLLQPLHRRPQLLLQGRGAIKGTVVLQRLEALIQQAKAAALLLQTLQQHHKQHRQRGGKPQLQPGQPGRSNRCGGRRRLAQAGIGAGQGNRRHGHGAAGGSVP